LIENKKIFPLFAKKSLYYLVLRAKIVIFAQLGATVQKWRIHMN